MLKILAPLCAAVALSWAGAASAAGPVVIVTGTVEDASGELAYGRVALSSQYYGVGSGRYRFEYISDAIPDNGNIEFYHYTHWHEHDENGDYWIGGDAEYFEYLDIATPHPSFRFTATGITGTFVVPMGTPAPANPTGAFIEESFSGGAGLDFWYDGDDIGKTLTFRVTAIPEPATWAMMIVGFGLTGAALRRSRERPMHVVGRA